MKTWESAISAQLESTSNLPALEGHRDLVDQRWQLVNAFANGTLPDSCLSPDSQKLRKELFQKDGQLNEQALKSYKKRFTAYMQGLSNASERLNAVQKEEVEDDGFGDLNATTIILYMCNITRFVIHYIHIQSYTYVKKTN